MRKIPLALLLVIGIHSLLAQSFKFSDNVHDYIENPAIFEINQVPGRSPVVHFQSVPDALANDWNQSPSYLSLNGSWKFQFSSTPEESPHHFFGTTYNDQDWSLIPVPSNWQMQGYGHLKFRNIAHPFRENPPSVPRVYNPVGSYRKTFTVPANWQEQQIFLRFEGVSSAAMVWVNGKEVGYNQGSFEPSEYDITAYIQPGENLVAVKVFQWCDGTYLEDQDFWRLSGIFRDVYIYAMPRVHIRDFFVITDLDPLYQDATLSIEADIRNHLTASARGVQIRATLHDNLQRQVAQFLSTRVNVPADSETKLKLQAKVKNPVKWSAEKPNLYHLTLELLEGKESRSIVSSKVGFRKVEVKDQAILVNGVAVKLNAVNSHMQHPLTGRAMDRETMRKDLVLMKQFNINCVRTSHYPPNKEYLQLADELGIYVVNETGCEAHATEYLSDLPEWQPMYLDRVRKMVLRDRNHPSIIMWSAGNESGWGENICAMIREGKRLDPTGKPWMYGGNRDENPANNPIRCEEIVGPRYDTPFELETLFGQVPASEDPRPSFMDEYISAQGNALGGLDEYWEVIYKYPRLSGGAIWDYVSPGIPQPVRLLHDKSPLKVNTSVMGRAKVTDGYIDLSGHDEWVEVYRHPELDITSNQLSLSIKVYPSEWWGTGTFLTKGNYQFGIRQTSADSLEFYISAGQWASVKVPVPSNWQNNWHQVSGIYDGKNAMLYLNGKLVGQTPCTGNIYNYPFPVCIGRSAELDGQEHAGYLVNGRIARVRVFDKAIPLDKLEGETPGMEDQSLLWLDFDGETRAGEFYSLGIGARSYGTIWPDRTPQPEMWQLKKSAQPVKATWVDPEKGMVLLTNRFHFTQLDELDGYWKIWADGDLVQEGQFIALTPPQSTDTLILPFSKPEVLTPGREYRLEIGFLLKSKTPWANKGHEVAWDQLDLPWVAPTPVKIPVSASAPEFIASGQDLLVRGAGFEYRFSREKGRIVSMKVKGKEYLVDGPVPNVWRAPLANDLDAWTTWRTQVPLAKGMGTDVANIWRTAGLDQMEWKTSSMSYSSVPGNLVKIEFGVQGQGNNFGSGFDNRFVYTIDGNGNIELEHVLTPWGVMPAWLPRTGVQWVLPTSFDQITWYGRGPFENYPDRKTGAKINVYRTTADSEYQPYLTPQEHGLKTDTRWVSIEDKDGNGLKISGNQLFNYSVQLFDTDNLYRAKFPYQLNKIDGLVFNHEYASTGVGCTALSSWTKYRVPAIEYRSVIRIEVY